MITLNVLIYFIVLVFLFNFTISKTWNSNLQQRYDGYGRDWIFMPDGNDQPQVAVLKRTEDERDIFDESEISFILYTRYGSKNGTQLYTNDTKGLQNSNFDPSRQTKFITHGWKSSAMSTNIANLKDEYLKYNDYNIIMVDWQPLAASTFYLGPIQNTKLVGKVAAKFIDFLAAETGLETENIHFLGHSLGAHVAGNTGSSITSGHLGRITGLDPASPGFHLFTSNKTRLDSSDAIFVDIIHSCGGILGFLQPLGNVDFYPNAGTPIQPGCCCIPEIIEACSHTRATIYFTESINSKTQFVANKCDTWNQFMRGNCNYSKTTLMGEYVDKMATGSYFLETGSEPPYAISKEIIDNMI
ncbi:pancreatic triacylglycerol lipase isoform X1 [Apis mellifera]|uniref:phospholipase A1 n=2 Tax=Apis mellifera TaxID=7460 RepID=A0A7M7GV12_APIME|nr:pancreatic triacylglycerol lipase isoform X1 [Apis mellifera]|eukprot:XP_006567189.2 pancreatic triacylglycerol lipase isoform X1 [Apis mellifera]